ncbi:MULTISPECIES: hypothetical protein [unclassified Luteococcus]|uniref:hypothetical protein n=1 Tax=unclassified Luteococcus TaxID=2639923 RepID=UPI00313DCB99
MRKLAGLHRVVGFGASMALLAIASLLLIPVMMKASGSVAWGAVALGQSLGGVGSVVVGYGWNMAGPAQLAGANPTEARRQFIESLVARLVLFLPVCAVVVIASMLSAQPGHGGLAALGAVSSATVGLSANWFFVGAVQPWTLLATETIPRVLGTVLGMALMLLGGSAMVGVAGQLMGMVLAVAVSTVWVLHRLRQQGATASATRPVRQVLVAQRDGVVASVAGSLMSALPIVIVAHANPAAQPMFAFVDKLQRQMSVALTPFVTALQGWVPRGDRVARGRKTLWAGLGLCTLLSLFIFGLAPLLTRVLGGGVITTSWPLNAAMAVFVGLGTYELMLSHVVLSTFQRLRFVATATLTTGIASLVAIAPAAIRWQAGGALVAVLAGLALRAVVEVVESVRALGRAEASSNEAG